LSSEVLAVKMRSFRGICLNRQCLSHPDSGVDSELDDSAAADEQIAQIFESGNSERKGGAKSLTPDPTRMPLLPMPTPLPTSDLAPIPSDGEIFGINEASNDNMKSTIRHCMICFKLYF
jgi:hypothetical protein